MSSISSSTSAAYVSRNYRTRRTSLLSASRQRGGHLHRLQPPIMWNIQGMRGQMSSNCLWHACKAFFIGLLIFSAGAAMCVVGFYIDGVLGDPKPSNSTEEPEQTYYQSDPSRPIVKFSKLSYIGPIVMGVGGFIIVATCVMTFEARDSAAKVGPSFANTATKASALPLAIPLLMSAGRSRTRSLDVRSVASQTAHGGSSASLGGAMQKFDRKIIIDAFRKFSRTLRTSSSVSSNTGLEEAIPRYPSAPSLLNTTAGVADDTSAIVTNKSPFSAKSRSSKVPAALRHAMSIDSSSSTAQSQLHRSAPIATAAGTGITAAMSKSPPVSKQKARQAKKLKRNISVPIEHSSSTFYRCQPHPARAHEMITGTHNLETDAAQSQSSSNLRSTSHPAKAPESALSPSSILRSVNASVHTVPAVNSTRRHPYHKTQSEDEPVNGKSARKQFTTPLSRAATQTDANRPTLTRQNQINFDAVEERDRDRERCSPIARKTCFETNVNESIIEENEFQIEMDEEFGLKQ